MKPYIYNGHPVLCNQDCQWNFYAFVSKYYKLQMTLDLQFAIKLQFEAFRLEPGGMSCNYNVPLNEKVLILNCKNVIYLDHICGGITLKFRNEFLL